MDLVNGTQSHPNSSKISSFQRCHRPLTMLHPANCSPAPASGRPLQKVGRSRWEGIPAPFGGGVSIFRQLRAVEATPDASHGISRLVPACLIFSPYHHSFFVFSFLLLQHSGIVGPAAIQLSKQQVFVDCLFCNERCSWCWRNGQDRMRTIAISADLASSRG